jgi:hypothetical protein
MAGYIGSKVAVVSSGAERKKVFTATSGQTSFTGLSYTVNNVHVFQNGVRLVDGTDYTATNGNSITLTVGAAADDQVVVVSYNTFQTSDTVSASTGGTFAGDVNFTGAFTSQGIDDNATSTAMTLDSSGNLLVGKTNSSSAIDGTIVFSSGFLASTVSQGTANSGSVAQFRRNTTYGDIVTFVDSDATTVGSIGSINNDLTIGNGDVRLRFNDSSDEITPRTSDNTGRDAAIDLGTDTIRFKNLYLSGGVYLGGTGSANKLDDYEEGTFTLRVADAGSGGNVSSTTGTGYYIKVGRNVTIHAAIGNISTSGLTSGNVASFTGLPFTCDASGTGSHGTVRADSINFQASNSYLVCQVGNNSTSLIIKQINDNGLDTNTTVGNITSGVGDVSFTITYRA